MNNYLSRIDEVRWELSRDAVPGMNVPGLIYADPLIMEQAMSDRALQQVANVACLPGIKKYSFAMPDIHQGYGFAIGGVAAFDMEMGIICPGGVGYDICCGVRSMVSSLASEEVVSVLDSIACAVAAEVPSGLGSSVRSRLSDIDLDKVLEGGALWAVNTGMGYPGDLDAIENRGCFERADPACVSEKARKRGANQLGTLGSGNHFIEIQVVDSIYDEKAASVMGLKEGAVTVMIHCGSRGLGHQVCDESIRIITRAMGLYGFPPADRQLCSVPVMSMEGENYMGAMYSAANFALANRQVITHRIRQVFRRFFPWENLRLLYDVSHNMAHIEDHMDRDGTMEKLCVHRKGATRALPPGHRLLPERYRGTGQPVLIPGSMGTASYVLAGTEGAEKECYSSTCHGAGRVLSRSAARKGTDAGSLRKDLLSKGIIVIAESSSTLTEEAPSAYKDVDRVIDVVEKAGISRKVARLRPLAVIKG